MSKESVCLKLPKKHGEEAIILVNNLKIFNRELQIQRNNVFIYIPLIRQPSEKELELLRGQFSDFEILTYLFPERKRQAKTFIELLEDKLPPHLLASLPRSIDFIGDIAVIEVPPELKTYKTLLGEAVLRTYKNVRTVLAKAGAIAGTFRIREYDVIAGEMKTETIHKEYGCLYHVDLAKAYFSPRLSYEHRRVASLVQNGETVIDLFAGVGPFAILIAKNLKNVKVYAIDINPHAIEFLKKNIRLNKVEGKVHPILGDARQVIKEKVLKLADRVIMNLPEKSLEYVDVACEAIKPEGGIVHFYGFISASQTLESMISHFTSAIEKCGRKVEKILFSRLVRATAPHEWQAVLDAKIR
ncbi:MAG: class I SAM-dependent methyltransferase family protein [Candidatus Bathyarchaeia archaeon]